MTTKKNIDKSKTPEINSTSEAVKKSEFLTALAVRIHRREVFTSWQIHQQDSDLLTQIFLPLALMEDAQRAKMLKVKPVFFYGDLSSASPMGINGYPMLFSCGYLGVTDAKRLHSMICALEQAEKTATAALVDL